MRNLRGEGGQVMAVYAVSALLIAFMTFLTLSIGVRVREKIKVQTAADAAAYGMAVSQARALNTLAWGNRAVVAEYVSMLSMIAHSNYLDFWVSTLKNGRDDWRDIEIELSGECAACEFVECLCPACECISAANKARNRFAQDSFDGAPSCPGGGSGKFGSYACADSLWHTGSKAKSLHQMMDMGIKGYVGVAGMIGDGIMTPAANKYYSSMAGPSQQFAKATGQAVDSNITAPSVGFGSSASQSQYYNALWTQRAGPGHPVGGQSDMWDSYHEILSGTRTGFINNQSWHGGVETLVELSAIKDMMQCGAIAYMSTSEAGGAMTLKGDYGRVKPVNEGHEHKYQGGQATGEGGRHAGSAENHGDTSAGCYIMGSCAGGYSDHSNKGYYYFSTNAGCDKKSYELAGDGHSDGDQDSPASNKWINGVSSTCSGLGPGISTAFARYGLPKTQESSASQVEKTLWNQPRTYALLQKDLTKDGKQPWDFDLNSIGNALLSSKGKDVEGGGSLSAADGKAFETTNFSNKRFNTVQGQSAGLSYYHNPKSWQEVPNVWNPFWRAKLDQPYNGTSDLTGDDKKIAQQAFGY